MTEAPAWAAAAAWAKLMMNAKRNYKEQKSDGWTILKLESQKVNIMVPVNEGHMRLDSLRFQQSCSFNTLSER